MPLQREDWVKAAERRLGGSGIASVRVEVLARDLGTTKGSFYWHFKDRGDLLAAVLLAWETMTDELNADAMRRPTPRERLEHFLRLVSAAAIDPDLAAIESAILAWAHQDPAIAERVTAIEGKRIGTARRLLAELGFPAAEADWWAEIGYTVYAGMVTRTSRDPAFAQRSRADYLERIAQAAELLIARESGDAAISQSSEATD